MQTDLASIDRIVEKKIEKSIRSTKEAHRKKKKFN